LIAAPFLFTNFDAKGKEPYKEAIKYRERFKSKCIKHVYRAVATPPINTFTHAGCILQNARSNFMNSERPKEKRI